MGQYRDLVAVFLLLIQDTGSNVPRPVRVQDLHPKWKHGEVRFIYMTEWTRCWHWSNIPGFWADCSGPVQCDCLSHSPRLASLTKTWEIWQRTHFC